MGVNSERLNTASLGANSFLYEETMVYIVQIQVTKFIPFARMVEKLDDVLDLVLDLWGCHEREPPFYSCISRLILHSCSNFGITE